MRPSTTRGGGAQVADARVRARADEHAVEADVLRSACPARGPCSPARAPRPRSRGSGTASVTADDLRRVGAPADHRAQRAGVDDDLAVEASRRRRCAARARPGRRRRRARRPRRRSCRRARPCPARPPPSIVMLQTVMRPSIESASMAGPAYSTTWPAAPSTPIWPIVPRIRSLAVTPKPSVALVADAHRLGLALDEALGGQHVLDLARADAEGQRAEGAVGGGVAVAADDRHARLGDAELGPDDVDDALAVGAQRVERDAELLAVALERLDLHAAELVADARRDRRAVGGHVVVGRGQRAVGPAHRAPGEAQAVEGLRARDLVDEVQVDVEQALGAPRGRPRSCRTGCGAW